MINKLDRVVYSNWVNKLWHIHPRGHCSAEKKVTDAGTSTGESQSIMLSEIIWTQKSTLLFRYTSMLPSHDTVKETSIRLWLSFVFFLYMTRSKVICPPNTYPFISTYFYTDLRCLLYNILNISVFEYVSRPIRYTNLSLLVYLVVTIVTLEYILISVGANGPWIVLKKYL